MRGKRALLISGGPVDLIFLQDYLSKERFDMVVCADAGMDTAFQLGIKPDHILGDFDSASQETLSYFREQGCGVDTFPAQKDATDTELALDFILSKQVQEIVIVGATGRRLDHFLGNLHILYKTVRAGVVCSLVDPYNRITMTDHPMNLRREQLYGSYISLFPFAGPVKGLCLSGFAYEVEDFTLEPGSSRGISNEIARGKNEAKIRFTDGILLVIESRESTVM